MIRILQQFRLRRFMRQSLEKCDTLNADVKSLRGIPLHLITVAFNNEVVLGHQVKLIRKNISDDYVHVIADNSSDYRKRDIIKELCREYGLTYISLPTNPYTSGSPSHGVCLRWICKHYVELIQPKYFGFLDHDVYPIKNHSVIALLQQQGIYGHSQERNSYWYLWPGLCFYAYDCVKNIRLDFDPVVINGTQLDTGGANWTPLYSTLDKNTIVFPEHRYLQLRQGDIPQSDKMELIGDWLHSFNGSYWMDVKPKEDELGKFLFENYYQ
jgi:hypothetical protein